MAHHHQHYQSPFGDTTFTKVFVGGLAWETPIDVMRSYFEQFGEIYEAVIINDKNTGKSKGYGFVTFRDAESAKMACDDPNPMIGGRRANCNIASLGRPRPSPPRGRNQLGNLYQGGGTSQGGSPLYRPPPAPLQPPHPVVYPPPYGYTAYPPDYGYHQPMYSPHAQQTQYYNQVYGASSSTMGAPYYYGYSMQAPRGALSIPPAQRIQGPSYLYYPTPVEAPSSSYAPPPHHLSVAPSTRLSFPPSTERRGSKTYNGSMCISDKFIRRMLLS
ncbi:RNA-binding protein 38 [Phtheirospermum japonicum]|uniref:RNA-binding protein 38 n=1 Tax=Phtheirospermum japonicum TaxID=374723 RepID=A0A830C8J0_9LAMI|nr:RNA-binding protein 38 [Phtheirospermum japonicum]